jgi:hypothetical protein
LIQIKVGLDAMAMMPGFNTWSIKTLEHHMPTETIVVLAAIIAAFVVFGAALAWAGSRAGHA